MARPKREGLDYFPLDVNAGIDDEIELIEAEYGLEGFAIFIKLLQKIYKTNYYIMWTEKEKLQFSKRVNVDINRVNVIIMACLKWNLFDKSLFDKYQILTSRGIQKRFLLAIDRRTSYEFYKEYLLLSENEVNVYKNLIIVSITANNADINPQRESKEKEKVKESKEKEDTLSQSVLEILKYFETLKPGQSITAHQDAIKVLIDMYSIEWVKDALQETIKQKGKFIQPYMEKILKNWQTEGKEETHGSNRPNNTEGQGKYTGFKPAEPNISQDIDTTDIL